MALCSALIMGACNGAETGDPNRDRTPPTVVEVNPSDGLTGVAIDRVIKATFSEPIDEAKIDTGSFSVSGGVRGAFSFLGNTVTLTPSEEMAYSTEYTVTLSTGITDTASNHLEATYSWSFTTQNDPATSPPEVIETNPAHNAVSVSISTSVSATFSKDMDPATLTTASFALDHGVTGAVSYANRVVTLIPDSDLEYATVYTANISTFAADTSGIHLESRYWWTFTTEADPLSPTISLTRPTDSAVIGDTVTIIADVVPVGGTIDSVVFIIDGVPLASVTASPWEYTWDASGEEIGSLHSITATVHDSDGRQGISGLVFVHYQWELLATDFDQIAGVPQDVLRLLYRSTDSLLELRYEFLNEWEDVINDTLLDLGVFFDTDQNAGTGRDTLAGGLPINDIGAEYRVIIGLHGLDAFAGFNPATDSFEVIFDVTGFPMANLPDSAKFVEFGLYWADLDDTDSLDLVSMNFTWPEVGSDPTYVDWLPDQGNGHVTIRRNNRYLGGATAGAPALPGANPAHRTKRAIPFD